MLLPYLLGVAAALATGINAQTTSSSSATSASSTASSSASRTSSAPAQTHSISVGAQGFVFSPAQLKDIPVGDVIVFVFYPGGHTVARSDFTTPCIPYEYTGLNRKGGFYSGQIAPQVITNNPPTFNITVTDTDPIFFYCTAPGSCYQQHMIGVINPTANETYDLQLQYAMNATFQLAPGDPWPSETVTPSATPSSGAVGGSGSSSGGSSLSGGAIAGIAIGGAAALVLIGVIVYLCGRRGGLVKAYRHSAALHTTAQPPVPPMTEAKYAPKSPGQETFTTAHNSVAYSLPPGHVSPSQPNFYSHSPGPIDPNAHPAYQQQQPYGQFPGQQQFVGAHSPLMGSVDGTTTTHHTGSSYYQQSPPPQQQQHPIELPTSDDPGNSPLPNYQPSRGFSWSQGAEGQYRPGDKPYTDRAA